MQATCPDSKTGFPNPRRDQMLCQPRCGDLSGQKKARAQCRSNPERFDRTFILIRHSRRRPINARFGLIRGLTITAQLGTFEQRALRNKADLSGTRSLYPHRLLRLHRFPKPNDKIFDLYRPRFRNASGGPGDWPFCRAKMHVRKLL